ncbi:hypothetical protein TNCV_3473551 [Trichonephila clavipes]|nr:hypothetical protein TNCV_3473551 [Trichonephila clavipes]
MDERFPPSEVRGRGTKKNDIFKIVEGKEFNVYRNSDCEVKVKAGLCEGRVKAVAMGAQRMLINSLREDTEYLLDLGVNGMGQSIRTLPVVWTRRSRDFVLPNKKERGACCNTPGVEFFFRREGKKEKRREREESGLGWRKGKSPALDGEGMRGEPWLERTGRVLEKGLSRDWSAAR